MPASYPPILGGLQTVSHALARHLIQKGHDARVVTGRYPRRLARCEELDGVPVTRELFLVPTLAYWRQGRADLSLAALYHYPLTLIRLWRLMRRFRPQVVNVHFPNAQTSFVLWLRRRFHFRLVVSLHGAEVARWLGADEARASSGFVRWRRLLEVADSVTACSGHLLRQAGELVPAIKGKGTVIHNGIDPERFRKQMVYQSQRPYFLAYGRFTPKKGFDMLLTAWARVAPDYPQTELILAGDGDQAEELKRQVQELDIAGQVKFFGQASAPEVVQLLNGCRFVIVPSRQEPFGIVALEALAAGRPLLATRVGGLPEFIDPDNGDGYSHLVPPNVEKLARGLRTMLDMGEMPTVPYEERRVLYTHRWEAVLQRYEQVICDC